MMTTTRTRNANLSAARETYRLVMDSVAEHISLGRRIPESLRLELEQADRQLCRALAR